MDLSSGTGLTPAEEQRRTQQEIRVNSTTIVIVTILGFVISVGLYIFFVILPLRRSEVKAEQTFQSVQDTSAKVSKLVTDLEEVLGEVIDIGESIEDILLRERTILCENGAAAICGPLTTIGGFQQSCEAVVNEVLAPICFAPLQPALTSTTSSSTTTTNVSTNSSLTNHSSATNTSCSSGGCNSTREYSANSTNAANTANILKAKPKYQATNAGHVNKISRLQSVLKAGNPRKASETRSNKTVKVGPKYRASPDHKR
jgi:hypothetical protein